MVTRASNHMTRRARTLRQTLTISERRLWNWLRNRTLGEKFRRQFPVGPYVLDFYCPDLRLAIEVDGRHHDQPGMLEFDDRRSRDLLERGIAVIRIRNITIARDPGIAEMQLRFAIEERRKELRVPL